MKKDYTKTMNYAVVSMIDRITQDDKKSKIQIAGLFENPIVAEDSFIPYLPNKEIKRYLLRVEDLACRRRTGRELGKMVFGYAKNKTIWLFT